ncbi:hypothetical protein MY4824_009607 [Beauveria thailandica]
MAYNNGSETSMFPANLGIEHFSNNGVDIEVPNAIVKFMSENNETDPEGLFVYSIEDFPHWTYQGTFAEAPNPYPIEHSGLLAKALAQLSQQTVMPVWDKTEPMPQVLLERKAAEAAASNYSDARTSDGKHLTPLPVPYDSFDAHDVPDDHPDTRAPGERGDMTTHIRGYHLAPAVDSPCKLEQLAESYSEQEKYAGRRDVFVRVQLNIFVTNAHAWRCPRW